MRIKFLGGTSTVTGSKFLVTDRKTSLLVDCGLFQGLKEWRLRNREPFPVEPGSVDAVVLTHAHLDHAGYLPLFVKNGFSGPVFATSGTLQLCSILLPDSGRIQEEDARYANKKGFSKHVPAEPLYTERDAETSLRQIEPLPFAVPFRQGDIEAILRPAGHILGAAMVELTGSGETVIFSGDLGRDDDLLMSPPSSGLGGDWIVVESTYGDRVHPSQDHLEKLAHLIRSTIEKGGAVLIPAFAVGRAQALIYSVYLLKKEGRVPDIPLFLDSPMATNVLNLYGAHVGEHRLSKAECDALTSAATLVTTVSQSKALSVSSEPRIIISASGMATGGRVLHHLRALAGNRRNTIVFAGYQAEGTRGAAIVSGASSVRIHGSEVSIGAQVEILEQFSAHADSDAVLAWLSGLSKKPKGVFVVHGERSASEVLRARIHEELGLTATVPDYLDEVDLT